MYVYMYKKIFLFFLKKTLDKLKKVCYIIIAKGQKKQNKKNKKRGRKKMKIYKEVNNAWDFEFWSGGKDTVDELLDSEIQTIFSYLEDITEEMSETELNDFFWFERDTIAEWLGYNDFDEIIERNKK